MEKVSWIQNGSEFRRVEGNITNVETLPVGIYNVDFNPLSGWSLELVAEKFEFSYKLYGLQNHFVQHVLKTFNSTKGNLGILLNGTKGTGKTVTAKVLANEFHLPIINVKSFGENNTALIEYLSSFNFDCVFFLDEFEKNWSDKDSSILQIMDGVYTSVYRRIFLLTTNETSINENLLSRPSRIRYVKEFGNLEKEIVKEYLEDNLTNPECIDCIIDFVDTLQISTIDILKSIVEDINIHGFDTFIENKEFFNVKTATYYYQTYVVNFGTEYDTKSAGYTLDQFCKDIKTHERVKQPYRYMYDTDEAFSEAMKEYNKNRVKISISNRELAVSRSFKTVKVGDLFGHYDAERVIQVDHKRNVFITMDEDGYIYFYYVKNPNTKPSLYSSNQIYTNPYYDMF